MASIPECGSKDAYELAFEMRSEIREEYVLRTGNTNITDNGY